MKSYSSLQAVSALLNGEKISFISFTSNIYSTKRSYRHFLIIQSVLVDIQEFTTISLTALISKLTEDCRIYELNCNGLVEKSKEQLPSGYYSTTRMGFNPGSQERSWSLKLFKDSQDLYAYVLESGDQAILYKVLSSSRSSSYNFNMKTRQQVASHCDFFAENVSQLGSSDFSGVRIVHLNVKVLNSSGQVLGVIEDHFYYDTTDDTSNRYYHEYNFPATIAAIQEVMEGSSSDPKISGTYRSIQSGTPSRILIETQETPWMFKMKDLT